jgi:hypothetical protein
LTYGTLNEAEGIIFEGKNWNAENVIHFMLAGDVWLESDQCEENSPVQEMGFDPEKCLFCTVEGGQTLVHGPGGRGYGLGNTGITSGY